MNFDLFDHTILFTRAGSRAYGTNRQDSDIDVKGVCIPPIGLTLGTGGFEQADKPDHFRDSRFRNLFTPEERVIAENTKIEGSVYGLRKFVQLAEQNNPNILDVLFCADKDVLKITESGKILRDNRDIFISAKCKYSFSGYAVAQARRIKTHREYLLNPPSHKPSRSEFDLPEHTLIPADQLAAANAMISKQIDSWEFDFSVVQDPTDRDVLKAQIAKTMSEIIAGIRAAPCCATSPSHCTYPIYLWLLDMLVHVPLLKLSYRLSPMF